MRSRTFAATAFALVIAACGARQAASPAASVSTLDAVDASRPTSADGPLGVAATDASTTDLALSPSDAGAARRCPARCYGKPSAALVEDFTLRAKMTHRYNIALAKNPELRGRIGIVVLLNDDGTVCDASVARDDIGDADFMTCALGVLTSQGYAAPVGGCIEVTVPIAYDAVPGDGGAGAKAEMKKRIDAILDGGSREKHP